VFNINVSDMLEVQDERSAAAINYEAELARRDTNCIKCGGFCPSGTLENGLCLDCDLIGKRVNVQWGKFGITHCLVDRVSITGTVYVRRWNKRRGEWTVARPADFYKGIYYLRR
jgi:hypothetical protein